MNSKNPGEGLKMILDYIATEGRFVWSILTVIILAVTAIMGMPWILAGLAIFAITPVIYWLVDVQNNADKDWRVKQQTYLEHPDGCWDKNCKSCKGE